MKVNISVFTNGRVSKEKSQSLQYTRRSGENAVKGYFKYFHVDRFSSVDVSISQTREKQVAFCINISNSSD